MKYILILYMCSMVTGKCPTNTYAGYQFNNHYDCVMAGYGVAQSTYKNLKEIEEWDKEYIEKNKMVVRFECKELRVGA